VICFSFIFCTTAFYQAAENNASHISQNFSDLLCKFHKKSILIPIRTYPCTLKKALKKGASRHTGSEASNLKNENKKTTSAA